MIPTGFYGDIRPTVADGVVQTQRFLYQVFQCPVCFHKSLVEVQESIRADVRTTES